MARRNKKAHHVNASKGGFRGAIGGASPAGVGATAGVNLSPNRKYASAAPKGAGIAGKARKAAKPHGISAAGATYGIVDGRGSGGDLSSRANSLFKIAKGKGKIAKDGGSHAL
jgi:hypothetical protein